MAETNSTIDLTSVDYPARFCSQQAPVNLNFICAIRDTAHPGPTYRYCELGCGVGETTCLLAAANPQSEFVGIDLSASHIRLANALAAEGGLTNVSFLEADLVKLDLSTMEDFDYITMHGLYSWVPQAVRQAVLNIIDKKLRPGGLVYVSYNTWPGWACITPLRWFALNAMESMDGTAVEKVPRVLEQLVELRETGSAFFAESPVASRALDRWCSLNPQYFIHEFLAAEWNPRFFADVDREMSGVGLHYVGDANVLENTPEIMMTPEAFQLLGRSPDRRHRETTEDFIVNRMFRTSVFVRGVEVGATPDTLGETLLGLTMPARELKDTIKLHEKHQLPIGGRFLDRLKALLSTSVLSVSELAQDDVLSHCPREEFRRCIILQAGAGNIHPFTRRGAEPLASSDDIRLQPKLNQVLLQQEWADQMRFVAAPAIGTGLPVSGFNAALLESLGEDDPVTATWETLKAKGVELTQHGNAIEGEAENLAAVADILSHFRADQLPTLARLGVVGPPA